MKFPFALPMLLDGATATNLMAMGMPSGVCMEKWICDNPSPLKRLQSEFIKAGSQAVYAPTFGASRLPLSEAGLSGQVEEINRTLVQLSQSIAGPHGVLVGGDVSPSGLFVAPYGDADFDDIYDLYREQIRVLDETGVDFLIIETQTSLADMRAAVLAARTTDLPIFVTITVDASGRTLTGAKLLPTVITLQAMGVDAIGLNCCFGPRDMAPLIADIIHHTTVPLIAKPNAGIPMHNAEGSAQGYLSPRQFAADMKLLLDAGAQIVGGCCGTTPAHILELHKVLKEYQWVPKETGPDQADCYAAAIETEAFFLSDHMVFSEPIECSPGLAEDLIDLNDERVHLALIEIHSIDDARQLAETGHMSRLPLAVQADSLPILDAALRYFQGRLVISSDCAIERPLMEPLAAKYGAIIY